MESVKHGELNYKCEKKYSVYYSLIPFTAVYECYNCGNRLAILETVDTDNLGHLASNAGLSSDMECPDCQDEMRTVALDKPVLVLCEQEMATKLLAACNKGIEK